MRLLRGPLSVLGLVLGLAAAGVIIPQSCSMSVDQADRLHLTLPVALPLAFLLAATLFRSKLAPRSVERPVRWVALALGMVLVATSLFALAAGGAYEVEKLPSSALLACVVFAPLLVPLLFVAIGIVAAARSASRVRPGSLLKGTAERLPWTIALGAAAPIVGFLLALDAPRLAPQATWAWALSAAAIPVLLVFAVLDHQAQRRLDRVMANADADLKEVDLGLGDDRLLEASAFESTYRVSRRRVVGAYAVAQAFLFRARAGVVVALACATIGVIVGRAALLVPMPPPPPPVETTTPGLHLWGC